MVEVIATDEFVAWLQELDDVDAEAVADAVNLLEALGIGLGSPRSSDIKGSRYALRELRVQSKGRPLRPFYVFDPKRQAVLLLGGDKQGDDRFYEVMIPKAEKIYEQYLDEQKRGLHDKEKE